MESEIAHISLEDGSNSNGNGTHQRNTPSSPADVSEEDRRRAEEFKENGNKLFAAKHYAPAIEAYTKAIELNPVGSFPSEGTSPCDEESGSGF